MMPNRLASGVPWSSVPRVIKQTSIADLNKNGWFAKCVKQAPKLPWGLVMDIMYAFRQKMLWDHPGGEELNCTHVAQLLEDSTPTRLNFAILVVLNGHDAPTSKTDSRFQWDHYKDNKHFPKLNLESRGLNRLKL